jgi:hypothetical protein
MEKRAKREPPVWKENQEEHRRQEPTIHHQQVRGPYGWRKEEQE